MSLLLYAYEENWGHLRERMGWIRRLRLPVSEQLALYLASIPIAALALIAMIAAGHSGARLVWKSTP